jgi:two-component system nitrate/nitrite response regulator NarL
LSTSDLNRHVPRVHPLRLTDSDDAHAESADEASECRGFAVGDRKSRLNDINHTSITVIVADDHPVVLHGLVSLLSIEPGFRVLAACPDGATALEAIRKHVPDIALLDIKMPRLSGLEVLARISKEGLPTKTVFLTATASDRHVLAAITRRAPGLLLKETAADALVECLRTVAAGRRWIPPEVMQTALSDELQRLAVLTPVLRSLTSRERQVMDLVADGLCNKEVAQQLALTEGTVKIHLHSIFQKTGISNRTTLAAVALRLQDSGV